MPAGWRCFEPADLEGVSSTTASGTTASAQRYGRRQVWRRRRRGRSVSSALLERQRPAVGKAHSGPSLGFHVAPRSEGLLLLFEGTRGNRTGAGPWNSVEVSFRQAGVFHTRVLLKHAFLPHGTLQAAVIEGLANLHHVDKLAVCLDGKDAPAGGAAIEAAVAEAAAEPGCACELASGRDVRLGRRCENLLGMSPSGSPIDFVVPRAPQTLSALIKDLGISPAAAAGGAGAARGATARDFSASIAVGEFNHETFLEEDVRELRRAYGLEPPGSTVSIIGKRAARGELDDFATGGEGSLDLQVASVLSPGAPMTWWSVSPFDMDGFILSYAVQVNDAADPPLVHSISWGDAESLFPPSFVERLDYELMKFALRGITVLIASGDNGISATGSECAFVPDIVGSSPWVTTVGATMPSLASAPYCSEPAIHQALGGCVESGPITCSVTAGAVITSSGYWSLYRSQPSYQVGAVQAYLQQVPCAPCQSAAARRLQKVPVTPCQHLNSQKVCELHPLLGARRAAPDVALPGNSYPTLVNGSLGLFDGTSASAPAFAAMISLLNAEQRRRGQPPLGFLNPWMYQTYASAPGAFVDVVVGDTGSTEKDVCDAGFRSAPGWDPATGLGVPQYDALLRLLPESRMPAQVPQALDREIHLGAAGELGDRLPAFAALLGVASGALALGACATMHHVFAPFRAGLYQALSMRTIPTSRLHSAMLEEDVAGYHAWSATGGDA